MRDRARVIPYGSWPRAMRLPLACAYLSLGQTKFLQLVQTGRLPQGVKIDGITCWDRIDLDAAFEDLKQAAEERPNSFDTVLGLGQ
jgi:predicted DNA-binding transcriptional regulator AlpA